MLEQEVKKRIASFINALARKEVDQLAQLVSIAPVYLDEGETVTQHLLDMSNWIEEQLALWAEDEGHPFVIDAYHEDQLDWDFHSLEDNAITYRPTSFGEELDFWFDIELALTDDGQPLVYVMLNL